MSCAFPLGQFTVVSGPSGSGKSSLAFDTLYAEGQRRYLSSLSSYARQFWERLPRPEVERVTNLPPAVAVAQNFGHRANARATVGSASDILDLLRLLFAHAGETRCCGARVPAGDHGAVTARVAERFRGERVSIAAPDFARAKETPSALRARLLREGRRRLLLPDGVLLDLAECNLAALRRVRGSARLLIDRLEVAPKNKTRLAEALAEGFACGDGVLDVVTRAGESARYRNHFACEHCGRRHPESSPDLFSHDAAFGACADCQGFGRRAILDRALLVPDPARTLKGGAVHPLRTRGKRRTQSALLAACAKRGIPTDVPWRELDADARDFVIEGQGAWRGVRGFFERLEKKRYRVQARVLLARYRSYVRCESCEGTRLNADARAVFLPAHNTDESRDANEMRGKNSARRERMSRGTEKSRAAKEMHGEDSARTNNNLIELGELSRRTLGELAAWANALHLNTTRHERAASVLALLRARLATACEVGLDYLALDRPLRTLSSGEAQRIALARALGGALSATLYVLDEPSVGLHARDLRRLVRVLHGIRAGGNTVVVVEHAPEVLAHADHVIDLGPGAGRNGGRVLAEGTVAQVRANADSPTGRVLAGRVQLTRRARAPRTRAAKSLKIRGARAHNLQNLDVEVPLGELVFLTGVSGAGKSSLAHEVLVNGLRDATAAPCENIRGAEHLREVIALPRTPPARSTRSNAATVSGAFDGLRRAFAALPEARAQKRTPGWFSFNVAGGRCEHCAGIGETLVELQFLEDLRVPCEHCAGTRYSEAARAFRLRGHSIVSALELSIDEARETFADTPAIAGRLEPYARVGLGYLTLAQPLRTLSGGELQRMRVAQALASAPERALFVLDEPSTGLHRGELQGLLDCFDALLEAGASIVVVEHNLHLISCADTILDLGPEGGPAGGRLVASGTPAQVAATEGSHTGAALRAFLKPAS